MTSPPRETIPRTCHVRARLAARAMLGHEVERGQRRLRPWLHSIVVVVALCSLGAGARAQPANDSAEALFVQGMEATRVGDLTRALELFQQSRAKDETANTLLNLAIVQRRLGKQVDALSTLDALDARPDSAEDPTRAEKSKKLRALTLKEVCELRLTVEPAQAVLTLDGVSVSSPVRALSGEHVLSISAEGFETKELQVHATAGEQKELRVALEPSSAIAPGPLSTLIPVRPPPTPPPDSPRRSRRLRVALSVAGAALAAAGVVTAVLLTRDGGPKAPGGETPFK